MITYKEEFFNKFVKEKVFSSSSFNVLIKQLKTTNFINDTLSQDETQFVDDASKILTVLLSIMRKPHISMNLEDIVVRSDQAHYLDTQNVIDTIHDSNLWKKKGNTFKPEHVHTNEHEDTFVTYENIVLCQVLDFIKQEADTLMKTNEKKINSIESYYGDNRLAVTPFTYLVSSSKNKELNSILIENKEELEQDFTKCNRLIKICNQLKTTPFYKEVNKSSHPFKEIMLTNIFKDDPRYNAVLKFYRKYIGSSANTLLVKGIYQDYCLLRLLKALESNKEFKAVNNSKIILEDNRFVINDNIIYENDTFRIEIIKNLKDYSFDMNITNKLNNIECHYYIGTSLDINNTNKNVIFNLFEDKEYASYTDSFMFALLNTSRSHRRILEISYENDNDELLIGFINSLTLSLKTNTDVYESVCPICGKKKIKTISTGNECITCHGRYVSYQNKKSKAIWIQRLGDVN